MGRRRQVQSDGRRRYRRVRSLQKYLKAFGSGEEGRLEREGLAARIGTSLPYLTHIGLGNRRASPALAIKISKATYGVVSLEDLVPDADWDFVASLKRVKQREAEHA